MDFKAKLKRKENSIWALLFTAILWGGLAICFDFYYDLNDDMLIKDIVAGIYSGTPSGFNMQMHYPLSFFISLLYRICGSIPWYGIYILAAQFGCIFLITERLLTFFEKRISKVFVLLCEAGMIVLLCSWELIFTQYTVTSALLAATAAFRMYTGGGAEDVKPFLKKNIGNVLLVLLAFLTRSEMLLLMLPFICVAGVCKWAEERPIFTKKNTIKYFSLFGMILAGLLLCQGFHMLAYSDSDWKEFNRFFDARTEFYDFHKIPPYAENEEFYQSIGMDENDWHLMVEWYNFGIDDSFDADKMEKLAEYAKQYDADRTDFKETFKKAFVDYRYRTFYSTDYPYNMIVIAMYVLVLAAALCNKHYRFLWELAFSGTVRSVVWLYMQSRERMPERITHSLYLMEFLILLAFLLVECTIIKKEKHRNFYKSFMMSVCSVLLLFIVWYGEKSIRAVLKEYERREDINAEYTALLGYVKENPENYYFADVFSTVKYSSKIMADTDNKALNMDLMGGWFYKSPLTKVKLNYFGLTDMEEALCENYHVLFVIKEDEEYVQNMTEWIQDYYKKKGRIVALKKIDSIRAKEKEVFRIYQVIGE